MTSETTIRSLTPCSSPKFNVKGTELSVALFGRNSRFAAYEVRTYDADRNADRCYVIRDAERLSDADLKEGKRPPIVGRTDDYDRLLAFVAESQQEP